MASPTESSNTCEAPSSTVEAEIEALKAKHPGNVKVITNVGELAFIVDLKISGVVIKFQIEATYPDTPPQVIIKADKMSVTDRLSLSELVMTEAKSLQGTPMLDKLVQKTQSLLQDANMDTPDDDAEQAVKRSPREQRANKKKKEKKNKKADAEVGNEKLPSMKIAEDVISRIWWDENLDRDCFSVGYLDRFIGVVEKCFNAFSWDDIASVDYNTLAIPKHRIQYFKYKDVKVWDKNDRLDNMFGSTGSGMTISDVISQYEATPPQEATTNNVNDNNDDDDDDDDIVITTGHEQEGATDEDGLYPREKYWGKKARPTHFLALGITSPEVLAAVAEVQRDIVEMEPGYAESIIPPERLHITLCCIGLDTQTDVLNAKEKLESMKSKLDAWQPYNIEIDLEDVDHFHHNCLYAKVKPNEKLMDFVNFLRKEVKDVGLEIRDVFDFVPHMTILKLMRQKFEENHTRYFDSRIYNSYSGTKFGTQIFGNIHLCSMSDSRQRDGFYECATYLEFP